MIAYKVVTLGSSGVGKTSIVLRHVRGEYSDSTVSTIGASFLVKNMELPSKERLRLEIWDTAGQERYSSLAPMYYRAAQVALIVYDVTDLDSWDRAREWVQTLKNGERADILKVLIGNKIDMETQRVVTKQDAQKYAGDEGIMHVEVSARTGMGVSAVFSSITNILVAARTTIKDNVGEIESGIIRLHQQRQSRCKSVVGKIVSFCGIF